ncbi:MULTISPECIES: nucleoside-diphosphate kinase [Paenibacillus]|uniref:Nucleoside diphosphate kinase n=2 Tax=Paenibacillus TaxID=44249 RepID=A0ABU1IVD5_9BACL|nr:nucleoside-diphosphate kinase [Paenibacillus hunanensis]MCL9662847.1 nucleoside-diphosphate kinase [Paenibacillus hunanensis]MDR6243210.1 nucleoside-diphosphate kinase [Paenibacillus hunanensis]GGJ10991.1 nucleoside diphosphate kinase [Paenibacillus hunanensis]
MERTFLMIKPDGVQRGLIGRIISRLEDKGFKLIGGKFLIPTKEQAERHYAEHVGKAFYGELIDFITSGPVFAMVWEGDDVITLSRMVMGKTQVKEALPGTIRGDFAAHTPFNLIHGSDSPESAEREIANFFAPDELSVYEKNISAWL